MIHTIVKIVDAHYANQETLNIGLMRLTMYGGPNVLTVTNGKILKQESMIALLLKETPFTSG